MSDEQYAEFHRLVGALERQLQLLSSRLDKAKNFPAYQNIIAMGATARAFIIQEMRRGEHKWLWVELLVELVPDMNPTSRHARGDLEAITAAWLRLADVKKW